MATQESTHSRLSTLAQKALTRLQSTNPALYKELEKAGTLQQEADQVAHLVQNHVEILVQTMGYSPMDAENIAFQQYRIGNPAATT